MPGLGLETLVRFVHVAVDVCVAAGHHRRASSLALELCDVVGTARVALDALPRALTSLRLCEAEDGEVGPARADAAESALRRARAAVPEHVKALRAARESFFASGAVKEDETRNDPVSSPEKKKAAQEEEREERVVKNARAKRTVSLYRAAARAAAAAGDRPAASQAQLELGDALCLAGDLEEAVRAWGACLDGVVGRYDVAFDKTGGGCRSLPASPEATLGMFGLRGCLRAAAAAARLATRTVRKPFRVGDEKAVQRDERDKNASNDTDDFVTDDFVSNPSGPLGVSARIEIARVASRLFEAASRASLGDARFFGGGFCGLDEPDAVSSSSTTPGPETDVTWEALGDGVVDGWDAFAFDARATCDDALAVSELLLLGANRLFAAEAAAAAQSRRGDRRATPRGPPARRRREAETKRGDGGRGRARRLGGAASRRSGGRGPPVHRGRRRGEDPRAAAAAPGGDRGRRRAARRGRRGGDVRGPGPAAFRGRRAFVVDAQRARRVVRRLRARGGGGQGGVRRAARGGGGARAREVADSGGGGGGAQGARRRPRDGFNLFRGFVFYVF
jgi:hypothetical protein